MYLKFIPYKPQNVSGMKIVAMMSGPSDRVHPVVEAER